MYHGIYFKTSGTLLIL